MSNDDRFDELMRLAFHDARSQEPNPSDITAAVRAATSPPRKLRGRRVATIAVALALMSATAFAVPQTRQALVDGFGTLANFLTRGGDPPGAPIPPSDNDATLNWFRGSDTTNGSILAQTQGSRLVAYRQTSTGMACIAYGTLASTCRPDAEWTNLLNQSPVQLTGPLPEPNSTGKLALYGITADMITLIDLVYADGTTEHVQGVRHGFVIFTDPKRHPTTLTALDSSGNTIATLDISHLQWDIHG